MQVLVVCMEISQTAKAVTCSIKWKKTQPGCQVPTEHQLGSVTASSSPATDCAHKLRQTQG